MLISPYTQGRNLLVQVYFLLKSFPWPAVTEKGQKEWTLNSSILQTKAFSSVLSCKLTFPECRAYTAQFGIHFYDSKSSKRLRIIAYAKQYKPFLRLLNHRKVIDQSRIASKGTATPILHSFLLCPMCKYNIIKQIRQQIFSTETVS